MNTLQTPLVRVARFANLRALAWAGDRLYASRGYTVFAHAFKINTASSVNVADFRPTPRRRLSANNRLTARLFRVGFHTLVVLPTGATIGAVPDWRPFGYQCAVEHRIPASPPNLPAHESTWRGGKMSASLRLLDRFRSSSS